MSNRSLTIVLPVYNGESRLTGCVNQMLELASDLTPQFSILIVDDGSTDDTSAIAHELSTRFPQVAVRRHRQRRGLGSIIGMVQRRITSDVVIMHDGVTPIDAFQVRRLWQESQSQKSTSPAATRCDVRELAQVRTTHAAMAKAHERIMGFHLVQPLCETAAPRPSAPVVSPATPNKPRPTDRQGVGQIPPLPRPNFLSVVADFALGE